MGILNKPSVDLSGQHINDLDVIEWAFSEKRKCNAWRCKCVCNNEVFKSTYELTKGGAKSCGCMDFYYKSLAKKKDLTGQRFFRLFVLEEIKERFYTPQGIPQIKYRCLCDCGNIVEVYAGNLRKGNTKSCGCLNRELASQRWLIDLVGHRFGMLVVEKRVEDYISPAGNKSARWLCKCDCGNSVVVHGNSLRRGLTKSCGCVKNSFGEAFIESYLTGHKIKHIHEYKISDLRSPKNAMLRFDFAILNKDGLDFLIEYQGIQHYIERAFGSETFGQYQREVTDPIKKEYCKTHNIKLIEIRYDEDIEEALNNIFQSANNANMSTPCQAS